MDDYAQAREVALRYLDYAPRTAAEVRRRLARAQYDDEVIADVVAEMERAGFVNDAQLSRDWVDNRAREKGIGRVRLALELKRKGVDDDIVDGVIEDIDPDEEIQTAIGLVQRKIEPQQLQDMAVRRRIAGYLQRRGYKWELIEQVFAKLTSK